ncbi:helix-turn-helix domain-containing protein [Peribacillus sp. NPDC096448]
MTENTLKRAIKLYSETNGMSVNDIVKATGVPRSTLYVKIR